VQPVHRPLSTRPLIHCFQRIRNLIPESCSAKLDSTPPRQTPSPILLQALAVHNLSLLAPAPPAANVPPLASPSCLPPCCPRVLCISPPPLHRLPSPSHCDTRSHSAAPNLALPIALSRRIPPWSPAPNHLHYASPCTLAQPLPFHPTLIALAPAPAPAHDTIVRRSAIAVAVAVAVALHPRHAFLPPQPAPKKQSCLAQEC
jgi:hypothetical protein